MPPAQLSLLEDLVDAPVPVPEPTPSRAVPARLSLVELDDALNQYADHAHADNTRRAYGTDWQRFERWCQQHGLTALPATPQTLSRYLAAMAQLGRKPSTIRRARFAIAQAHGCVGLPRPDADPRVRLVERGIRRTTGIREEGPTPVLPDDLRTMVRALGRGPRADRDRAMILVGFAGAFRRSELVALQVEHLHFSDLGVEVLLPRSKEDQEGRGIAIVLPNARDMQLCPVAALQRWLGRVVEDAGPVFVRIKDGLPTRTALNDATVRNVVQRAARRAGLQDSYSAHSLRGGFATAAHLAGQPDRVIQQHGRWRSAGALERYIRRSPAVESVL